MQAKEINRLMAEAGLNAEHDWSVISNYHFGGYARMKPELKSFMEAFYQQTGIPLDPIYTGKMVFGVLEDVKAGHLNLEGKPIVMVHTGGLQGIRGYNWLHGTHFPD